MQQIDQFLTAVHEGNTRKVETLLETDGSLSFSRDDRGRSAIQIAAARGFADLVELLLDHDADPNSGDQPGAPLFAAVRMGSEEIAELLFDAGARVNIRDAGRRTPLHVAAAKGYVELVRWLLESGANPRTRDRQRLMPLGLARKHLGGEKLETIEEAFAEYAEEMFEIRARWMTLEDAIMDADHRMLRHLLDGGADPNVPGKSGVAPLVTAATRSAMRMFRALLKAGANQNAKTADGDSLLGWVIREEKLEMARTLVAAGGGSGG